MSERCAGNQSRPTEPAPSSPGRSGVFPLARVCSVIYLAQEKSSAARGDFFFYKEKKQQHLKHDEMWELNSEKRNHDGNDSMAAAVCVGCESVMSGLKWRKGQLARPSRVFGITK